MFGVFPVGIGIVLLLASSRCKRDHPTCGSCGYNLIGTIGSTDRCPECGGSFAQVGIVPANPSRHRGMLVGGVVLITLPVLCVVPALLFAGIARSQAEFGQQRAVLAQQQALQAQQAAAIQQARAGQLAATHATIAAQLSEARAKRPESIDVPSLLPTESIDTMTSQEVADAIVQRLLALESADVSPELAARLGKELDALMRRITSSEE